MTKRLVLGCVLVPLLVPAARAVDGPSGEPRAETSGTVSAMPSGFGAATVVRKASAEVFRPAPVPDENTAAWPVATPDASDGPSLHPEFLGVHENSGGALSTASSEYDHGARFRPAGGMGLTIPMQ